REVLEQRDGEAAGEAEHLLEFRDFEGLLSGGSELLDDSVHRLLRDDPAAWKTQERALLDEVVRQPLDDLGLVAELRGDVGERRRIQAAAAGCLRDPLGKLPLGARQVLPGR